MNNASPADVDVLRTIADRHLPGSGELSISRTKSGVSTPVYRIERNGIVYYLRLAESAEANLEPEAFAHERLRACGVSVPEIMHIELFNHDLGRSLMITSEIPGRSLAEQHSSINVEGVLRAAGRDLALLQQVSVAGFGFVRRGLPIGRGLVGATPTLQAFAFEELEAHLSVLAPVLTSGELQQVQRVVERDEGLLHTDHAVLAHGDLDATHIYHHDGHYTGIIDFGEIRGTDRFYDLGHMALHDGETVPYPLLPTVLEGYAEVVPLPSDIAHRIQFWRLLIGIRAVARSVHRPPVRYQAHLLNNVQKSLTTLTDPYRHRASWGNPNGRQALGGGERRNK